MAHQRYLYGRKLEPTLMIRVDWDERFKRWLVRAELATGNGQTQVIRAVAQSRAQIDAAAAAVLLRLMVTDLESRIL